MSGPKGYSYRVESVEEQERRHLAEGQRRIDSLCNQLDPLLLQARTYPALTGRWAKRIARLRAPLSSAGEAQGVEDRLNEVMDDIRDAISHERSALVRSSLDTHFTALTLRLENVIPVAAQVAQEHNDSVRQSTQRSLRRVLAVIADHPEILDRCSSIFEDVERATEATPTAAAHMAMISAHRVEDALRDARREDLLAHKRSQLQTELEGIGIEPRKDLIRRIEGATTLSALSPLMKEVEMLRSAAEAEADRKFVLAAAAEVLGGMGYEVDVDPDVNGATSLLATAPQHADHLLKLVFRDDGKSFFTNVVALGETTQLQDLAVENDTCDDLEALQKQLNARGAIATRQFHHQAGAIPVERSVPARHRRRRQSTAKPREQSL